MTYHEITPTAFKYFCKQCDYWKRFFGLNHLIIHIETGDTDGDNATFIRNYNANTLNITLNEDGVESICGVKNKDLNLIAYHEICEGGLLGNLKVLADYHASQHEQVEVERELHAVVNRLWNMLKNTNICLPK